MDPQGGIAAVTVSTASLSSARDLYEGLLGMRPLAEWSLSPAEASDFARLWGLVEPRAIRGVWLQQTGATSGAVRLVELAPPSSTRATDGARPYDHGYVKNLDFFTDTVEKEYERLTRAGCRFLAPPVTYPVPWGPGLTSTEAHLPTEDGVKIALASLKGAPRKAFGEASHESPVTEVAAATQIVADYDRALVFYRDGFGCVPAAGTVVDDPALAAALHLPAGTRLRLCFIGPPAAVGGKVGLVAYEGEGVRDARSLAEQARPPHRGAVVLTFATDDADRAHARALVCGAEDVAAPFELDMPPFGRVRAASVRSPDGILLEIVEVPSHAFEYVPVMARGELAPGTLRTAIVPGLGRVAVAEVEGQVFAVGDKCPHLAGPLSHGVLRGRRITCPWHGWEIDVTTGAAVGTAATAAACRLRVQDGAICIGVPRGGT